MEQLELSNSQFIYLNADTVIACVIDLGRLGGWIVAQGHRWCVRDGQEIAK